jgi:hypothetical protein
MHTAVSTLSAGRTRSGNILIYLLGFMLVGSAVAKFARIPMVLEQFRVLGFEDGRLMFIGILEIVCAALFMLPRTRSIGLLLVSSYLGGAIATHVGHGQPTAVEPAFLLGLFWLGAWLRHPQILWSFES